MFLRCVLLHRNAFFRKQMFQIDNEICARMGIILIWTIKPNLSQNELPLKKKWPK